MTLLERLRGAVSTVAPIIAERSGTSPGAGSPPDADARAAPPAADQRRMRDALRNALDAHDGSRLTFRHLDRFERQFAIAGLRVVDHIPVDQLRRALADFEALVSNWSSTPLAELRSRMAVTLAHRGSASAMWRTPLERDAPGGRDTGDAIRDLRDDDDLG